MSDIARQDRLRAKPTRWYIWFPENIYALGPIPATNEREARQWAREWLHEWTGRLRLPKGFSCWPAD